jgi:hypothetical protein
MDPITIALAALAALVLSRSTKEQTRAATIRQLNLPATSSTRNPASSSTTSSTTSSTPPDGTPVVDTPRPGVLVVVDERNTRPVHVYADNNGVRFVDLAERDMALVWRAYVGTTKEFARYSNSQWSPLDALIGANSATAKLSKILGGAITAAGNFIAGRFAHSAAAVVEVLTEATPSIVGARNKQTAARITTETTAAALVEQVLAHPYNVKLRWRWEPVTGLPGPRRVLLVAPGEVVYLPAPAPK